MISSAHTNLTAYDAVEDLSSFSEESFQNYCSQKLKTCNGRAAFIKDNMISPHWKGRIAEIGSGNSKLLYHLEKEAILQQGWGYEVSRSRYLFAEKFKSFVNSKNVRNINQDVLTQPRLFELDLIIAVDVVLQLISPVFSDAENRILQWIWNSLKKGGILLLELNDYSDLITEIRASKEKILKSWQAFPEYDPWEYVLESISENSEGHLVWDKKFVKRNSSERSYFTNILKN